MASTRWTELADRHRQRRIRSLFRHRDRSAAHGECAEPTRSGTCWRRTPTTGASWRAITKASPPAVPLALQRHPRRRSDVQPRGNRHRPGDPDNFRSTPSSTGRRTRLLPIPLVVVDWQNHRILGTEPASGTFFLIAGPFDGMPGEPGLAGPAPCDQTTRPSPSSTIRPVSRRRMASWCSPRVQPVFVSIDIPGGVRPHCRNEALLQRRRTTRHRRVRTRRVRIRSAGRLCHRLG